MTSNNKEYPTWVCSDCARDTGATWPKGHVATFHMGICDVCNHNKSVTEPRDWGYPRFEELTMDNIIEPIETLQKICYNIAASKGFHDEEREFGTALMLIVSELAEALEASRQGDTRSTKVPTISHIEEELADAMIRILDTAQEFKYNLGLAIKAKLEYNKTRQHKHGKRY